VASGQETGRKQFPNRGFRYQFVDNQNNARRNQDPSVPPATTSPVAKVSAYPYRQIGGRAPFHMVAAVAREDPPIVRNPLQTTLAAIKIPPRGATSLT
jgi:hypothetical protein